MSRSSSRIVSTTTDEGQHVFISFVREDNERADRLCEMLKAAQIPFWRDLKNPEPGDDWILKIKEAIRKNSSVFLACFSDNSRRRTRNNMNEELHLAVEEFRRMPPGGTWIIPIRFDDGSIPDWAIGSNRSLNDTNRVDLFGDPYPEQAVALTNKINKLMGANDNAATTRAFVEESQSQERPELLRSLTKETIVNPAKQIELDDLITQEVRNALEILNDETRYTSQVRSGTNENQIRKVVQFAKKIGSAADPRFPRPRPLPRSPPCSLRRFVPPSPETLPDHWHGGAGNQIKSNIRGRCLLQCSPKSNAGNHCQNDQQQQHQEENRQRGDSWPSTLDSPTL